MNNLCGKSILIMATDGFEDSELIGPRDIFAGAGAAVVIASPALDPIQGRCFDDPTVLVQPDMLITDVAVADFDALVLPGGVINPDQLRVNKDAIALILAFAKTGKPVAAICHGPWLLVEADLLRGRRATCWPSIRTDLRNAGAELVDEAACVDGNIVTSRCPDDVPAFCAAITALIAV